MTCISTDNRPHKTAAVLSPNPRGKENRSLQAGLLAFASSYFGPSHTAVIINN